MYRTVLVICILILTNSALTATPAAEKGYTFNGKIQDKSTGIPLEFATIYLNELNLGTMTDTAGCFSLSHIPEGNWQVIIQYIGYQPIIQKIRIIRDTSATFRLEIQSLHLNEVQVMPEYSTSGTSTTIRQTALEHIQPSSLADIFQLLPGYLMSDGEMSKVGKVTSRQAGSDDNTALGMMLISDGTPISNNGQIQMFTGSDTKVSDRTTLNSGTDLRLISTDHLSEVEIIPGISSVKYGDLSSGVVKMKAKSGKSPFEIRVKANPLTKTVYAGKGLLLPGKSGTLHVGADFSTSRPDVRELMESFTRLSGQLNYTNQTDLLDKKLNYNFKLSYIGSIDKEKNDPDLTPVEDSYHNQYNNISFTTGGKWLTGFNWLNQLELTGSFSYISDKLRRDRTISLSGAAAIPAYTGEGEGEGIFLPSEYLSSYDTDSKPMAYFVQLSGSSLFSTGKISQNWEWGIDISGNKNIGKGAVYDLTRPPYPTSSSHLRPRQPKDIPGLLKTGIFAEDRIRWELPNGNRLTATLGIRLSGLQNLPGNYQLQGRWYAEPRLNMAWQLPGIILGNKTLAITLRGGYGEQAKFPTLDMLYPDKAWFDIIAANYYTIEAANRLVWMKSIAKDRSNPSLTINRNRKSEIGIDLNMAGFLLYVTAFHEKSNCGFESATTYFSSPYTKYEAPATLPTGKPELNDLIAVADTLLMSYQSPGNASKLIKKGIEYRLVFPEITPIRTRLEINGAYYKTLYDNSTPMYYRPQTAINGKPYLYAGIYDWQSDSKYRSRFNTTFRLNTHIPRFGLIFTTTLESVWFTASQVRKFSGVPNAYIGPDGIVRPFTEVEAQQTYFQWLIQKYSNNYFAKNKTPVSVGLNLKVTKAIGKHTKLSFWVNRLWDYNPKYENNVGTEIRNRTSPAFGAELTLTI